MSLNCIGLMGLCVYGLDPLVAGTDCMCLSCWHDGLIMCVWASSPCCRHEISLFKLHLLNGFVYVWT